MTTLRVHSIREVLAATIYQLGFRPTESLVVVSLRGIHRRVGLIARVDITAADTAAPALARHLLDDGAIAAVVLAYTADTDRAHDATVLLDDALNDAGIAPVGIWWVTDTDYRPINPQRPQDCPTTGEPLDLDTTVLAAEAVMRGGTVAASRDGLAIRPASHAARAEAARAIQERPVTAEDRTDSLDLWRTAVTDTQRTPTRAGHLAAALSDVLVRDAVLCDLIPGGTDTATALLSDQHDPTALNTILGTVLAPGGVRPNPERTRPAESVLAHVAAHTDSPAALTLLAFLAWWSGNGATANVHIDAAQALDPTYRLAALLRDVLDHAMAPGWARTT